jgi:glycosyltransferase involved in cell wall biosynthesis
MTASGRSGFPLVSICIPAFNAGAFLAETLESALGQDYPHLEIIVSDDCSQDNTLEIAKKYESAGVRLICQSANLGRSDNCNAVIRASRGKYICKLDADDLLEPEYISQMVPVMEAHPEIAFAHCACRLIDASGALLGYERSIHGSFIRRGREEYPRYVFGARAVNIVLLRRTGFDAVGGYDGRFVYTGDWKMHRELLKVGDVFYHDRVLASYRIHSLGKADVPLWQAQEHLMHLQDMDSNWPVEVVGKERLLATARRRMAMGLVLSAARVEPEVARAVLSYLPLYGNFVGARLVARLVQGGGAALVRGYCRQKLRLRQWVKKLLYKNRGCRWQGSFRGFRSAEQR